jgi:hypothetical protein
VAVAWVFAPWPVDLLRGALSDVGPTDLVISLLSGTIQGAVLTAALHGLRLVPAIALVAGVGFVVYVASSADLVAVGVLSVWGMATKALLIGAATAVRLVGTNWSLRRTGATPWAFVIPFALGGLVGALDPYTELAPATVQGAVIGFGIWLACRVHLRGKAVMSGMEIRE